MTKTEHVVERFDKARHDRRSFDCGRDELNAWLKTKVSPAHRVGSARVYVFHEGDAVVRGFYTLSAGSLVREDVPGTIAKGRPPQYQRFGFVRVAQDSYRLVLPMAEVRKRASR